MSEELGALHRDGYVILSGLVDPAQLVAASSYADELLRNVEWSDNDFVGRRTRRVYELLGRLGAFESLLLHPTVRSLVEAELGSAHQLGMLYVSAVDPGQGTQRLHYDAGIHPLPRNIEVETNVIWALDEFTETNGATLIAPGSHTWPTGRRAAPDDMVPAVMPAGSALVYSGRLWHGAGRNRSETSRRVLISESVVSWLRPADNHALALGGDGLRRLPKHLQELAGLGTHTKNFGYVGGRPADEWLRSIGE